MRPFADGGNLGFINDAVSKNICFEINVEELGEMVSLTTHVICAGFKSAVSLTTLQWCKRCGFMGKGNVLHVPPSS